MKKHSIQALFAHFNGTTTAVDLDQHMTTGITLELYRRYRDDYQTLAYFEGSTIKECVKQAFKWVEEGEVPISEMGKKQWLSFKRENIVKVAKELEIDRDKIDLLIYNLS